MAFPATDTPTFAAVSSAHFPAAFKCVKAAVASPLLALFSALAMEAMAIAFIVIERQRVPHHRLTQAP